MRTLLLALVVSAAIGLVLSAQGSVRPPGAVVAEAEQRVKDLALNAYGPELADHSKVIMGTLSADEARPLRRWDRVVQEWKKEKGAGAGPLLAEGVLFDCLSRLHGILTPVLSSETPVPYFLDLAAERPKRASKAFQAALKIDPGLTEARFRDARIRARKEVGARTQLEQLSNETGTLGYLAAMSRAEMARAVDDVTGALRWYERAIALAPGAPAPHFGLAALSAGPAVPFDALQHTDSYYSYPCVVLTEPVGAELSRRIQLTVKK
jgi:hypothetical protein